jgi:hypothetical protein
MDALDVCDDETAARRARRQAVTEAAGELLAAVADGTGGRQGRLDRARAVLDRWFTVEAGCTFDNDWCDAPELRESIGCSAVPGTRPAWPIFVLALVTAVLLAARRTRFALLAAGIVLALAGVAEASPPREDPGPAVTTPVAPRPGPFALTGSFGFSLQRSALAASVGVRREVGPRLVLGLDAEWNPWVTVAPAEAVAGVANVYATMLYRLAFLGTTPGGPELRTTVHAGASMLLFDLVGAPAGSVGPYLGWNLLGIAIPAGRARVVVDPACVALPVPQLHGVPFYYLQYRVTLGLELPV